MKFFIKKLMNIKTMFLLLTMTCLMGTAYAASNTGEKKRYMLEGVATPAVFASVIKTPQDRGPNAANLMKKLGCELLDYYVGVHNYKNYVVIECGVDVDLAVLQFTMFASGAITESTATEIITSAELKAVGERAQKISKAYKIPK